MNAVEALVNCRVPRGTAEKFVLYHAQNEDIWKSFEALALKLLEARVTHFGAKALFEVIRYNRAIAGVDGYSVNNNYPAYYARIFQMKYPQHAELFETRKVRGLQEVNF
jgi:hypothetical protein